MAMKHGGRGPGHLSRWTAATSPIPYLFASGSQGAWFDFTDTSTWYQDAAGTTPAATLGDVVGLVLDKSRGVSFAARRNLLNYSQQFDNAVYLKLAAGTGSVPTVTANHAAAPDGTTTADRIQFNRGAGTTSGDQSRIYQEVADPSSGIAINTVWLRSTDGVSSYSLIATNGTPATTLVVTGTWTRFEWASNSTSTNFQFTLRGDVGAATTADILAWGGQAEWGSTATDYQATTTIPTAWLGNHASQATTAQKPLRARIPLGGRRNMLTYTEDFSNAAWTKNGVGVVSGSLIEDTSTGEHRAYQAANIVTGLEYVFSVEVKPSGRTLVCITSVSGVALNAFFDVSSGVVTSALNGVAAITATTDGYYRISVTNTASATSSTFMQVRLVNVGTNTSYTGDGVSGIFVRNAQLERASSATAYQKVVADWDVTESGVTSIPALYFDGSDDSLATAAVDFTGTDKMTVFAGVEKLSDAARGMLLELGNAPGVNTVRFEAPDGSPQTYTWGSGGSTVVTAVASPFIAPTTNVLTGIGNISGDSAIIRVNGTQAAATVTDQGTGNFGNYAIYLGRRGGASLPFKGYMIGHMVIVGKLANASEIAAVEALERAATGAY